MFITSRNRRRNALLLLLLCRFVLVDPLAPSRFCFAISTRWNVKICSVHIQRVRNEQRRSRVAVETVRKSRLHPHERRVVAAQTLFWHIDVQIRALPRFAPQQRIPLKPPRRSIRIVLFLLHHELMHDDRTVRSGSTLRAPANVRFRAHPYPIAIVQTLHSIHPIRKIVHSKPLIAVQIQTFPLHGQRRLICERDRVREDVSGIRGYDLFFVFIVHSQKVFS